MPQSQQMKSQPNRHDYCAMIFDLEFHKLAELMEEKWQ